MTARRREVEGDVGVPRRLLVVGTNYPPLSLGGYELLCRDHVASLRRQGHDVTVLTSRHGVEPGGVEEVPTTGETVLRLLDFRWQDYELAPPTGVGLLRSERHERRLVERVVRRARPDGAIVWQLAAMSKSTLSVLHRRGVPTMLVVGEPWPVWDVDGDPWAGLWGRLRRRRRTRIPLTPLRALADRLIAPTDLGPALRAATPAYASAYLRDLVDGGREELRGRGHVVANGIDAALFATARSDDAPLARPLRLLYAGRVERRKGVHTAVETLHNVLGAGVDARLSIVGWRDPAYEHELRGKADDLGVTEAIAWSDAVERESMRAQYGAADVLLFPTIWPEPFGLVPLEAMAAGCLVLATGTGGSGEFLRDGENCLLFAPEQPAAAAQHVCRLVADADLVVHLRMGGHRTVAEHSLESFIAGLDAVLATLPARPARG
jgi:glycosyltransferase involved in cell wall biosynthesis